jgi:hypothetical protein
VPPRRVNFGAEINFEAPALVVASVSGCKQAKLGAKCREIAIYKRRSRVKIVGGRE